MTPERIHTIPSSVLFQPGTERLREWLYARGLRLSLAELEEERKRRRELRQQGARR